MEQTKDQENKYCRNCEYLLAPEAKYCAQCSQKYTTGKVAIWSFFKEFFTTIFNFDSKIFITLRHLFLPGRLTKEYFKGKHKTYLHPLRLFLVSAIIHFAIIGYFLGTDDFFSTDFIQKDLKEEVHNQDFVTNLDSNCISIAKKFDHPQVKAAFDSLTLKVKKQYPFKDSIDITYDLLNGKGFSTGHSIKNRDLRIAYKDYIELNPDELLDKYKIEDFWSRLLGKQFIKITKRGENFSAFIFGKLTWMILLMMPTLAFILKLLYIRRKRYYIEHLVFSFHYHSFAFTLVSILMLFSSLLPKWVIGLSFITILFYLYKAMRNIYNQGRFKTFLKFSILNLSYLVLFILFLALTFVFGFIFF